MAKKTERAGVLVEAAMCIPIILIFLYFLVDTSRYLITYQRISLIAYEGARFIASESGISGEILNADARLLRNRPVNTGSSLYSRIQTLMATQNISSFELHMARTTAASAPLAYPPPNSVAVQITIPFTPIFHLSVLPTTITVQATLPYLQI